MSMNKKEQAAFDAAILRAVTVYALRWTRSTPVPTDLPPPNSGSSYGSHTQGWYFNVHTVSVFEAWSTSISNGIGLKSESRSGSQNGQHLFSTKIKALNALRYALELKSANLLLVIDKQIEAEGAQ